MSFGDPQDLDMSIGGIGPVTDEQILKEGDIDAPAFGIAFDEIRIMPWILRR